MSEPDPTRTGARGPRAQPAVLSLPLAETQGATPQDIPRVRTVERTPTRIGRFQVLEPAGKGAMGVVYSAYDGELDRKVAIKVLLAKVTDEPAYEERLRREARAMARMVHPNVVAVHDVGTHEGRPFIAMDFVPGSHLRTWLADERPGWREVVSVFVQAGRGLAAAHAAGIVHRDFKPDNVLIAKGPGGEVQARVADFGIASAGEGGVLTPRAGGFDSSGSWTPVASMSGAGTPAYMAPERWDAQPATPRSDQFSFCVALFEALAGARPFQGATLETLVVAIATGKRQPIPATGVPRWVWRVVERGLAHAPADRFASMAALVAALQADPARRRRAIGAGAAVLAVGAMAVAGWQYRQAQARAECGDAARARVGAIWSAQRRAELSRVFADVGTAYAGEGWTKVAGKLDAYASALVEVRRDLCVTHEVDGELPAPLHRLRAECLDARLEGAAIFVAELEHTDATTVPLLAEAVLRLPRVSDCADPKALHERPPPPDDVSQREAVREARRKILVVRMRLLAGRPAQALPAAQAAADIAAALGDGPTLAEALFELGTVQNRLGKHQDAETSLSRAVELAAESQDNVYEAEAGLALLWVAGRRNPDRADDLVRATTAAIDRLVDGRRQRATLEGLKGSLRSRAGDLEAAADHFTEAIALWEAVDDSALEVGKAHNNLGAVHHSRDALDDAAVHYREALQLMEASLGANHPILGVILHNLGMIARDQGDPARGEVDLRRALDLTIEAVGPTHPRVASVLAELTTTRLEANRVHAAVATATQALAIAKAQSPPNPALIDQVEADLRRASEALR